MHNIEELKGPIAFTGLIVKAGWQDLQDAEILCYSEDCAECVKLIIDEIERRGVKYEGVISSKVGTWPIRLEKQTGTEILKLAIDALTFALQKAVDQYGQPGGPWNVPSEPGTWIAEAKHALEMAKKLQTNG